MKKSALHLLTVIPYVFLWQLEYFLHLNKFAIAIILLFPLLFLKRRDMKASRSIVYSAFLGLAFIFMLVEPAVVYGKAHLSISNYDLTHSILYSVLFSISLISMIHGVILKNTWKKPFLGMSLTAAVYVLSVTPLQLFLDIGGLATLLLFNVSFLVVLSYYLGFLYLKSNKNLLTSLTFLTIYSLFLVLNVNVEVSRYFNLVWEVISLSVLLFVTEMLLKESIHIKRAFRAKRVLFRKKEKSVPVILVGVLVVFFLLVFMPLITHESHYAIADPTDSMYPVIHPGSLLIVSHINAGQVHNGTVILFKAPWDNGTLYAHQVIGLIQVHGVEYFITKGINNPAKDPSPVPASDLVGKVSFALPYLGYVLIYSKVSVAMILVVIGISYFREARR